MFRVARFERCIRLLSRSNARPRSRLSPSARQSLVHPPDRVSLLSGNLSWNTTDDVLHQVRRFLAFSLLRSLSSPCVFLFFALCSDRLSPPMATLSTSVCSQLLPCRRGLNSHLVYRHEGPRDWPLQGLWLCRVLLSSCRSLSPLIFQTYGSSQEAEAAINAMNEQELDGRRVRVCA